MLDATVTTPADRERARPLIGGGEAMELDSYAAGALGDVKRSDIDAGAQFCGSMFERLETTR